MLRRAVFFPFAVLTCCCVLTALAAPEENSEQRESIMLVAAKHMADPNFARTVVLVMFPPGSGPSGVILNRPTSLMLRDVWPDRADRQDRTDTLYIGGPVQPDGLLFLFRRADPPQRAWRAIDDVYVSGDGDLLEELLLEPQPVPSQRFFAGYAGWAPGQLENEIARGDWHVLEADADIIYDTDHESLWLRMHQRATLLRADAAIFQPANAAGSLALAH